MADEFDIIDIVFDGVKNANTGLVLYKDRSEINETEDHIVVSTTGIVELNYVNIAPVVNINVFIKYNYKTKMPNRQKMKDVVRKLKASIKAIIPPVGMYWYRKDLRSQSFGEAKEGFDCTNIKLEIITEK